MKKILPIVVVLIFIAGISYFATMKKVDDTVIPPVVTDTDDKPADTIWPRELCFAKFGSLNERGFADNYTLRMILNKEKVTGELNLLPGEKDTKTGEIQGTAGAVDPKMMARQADLWWYASAEGMNVQEELKIIFGEGTASVGFGEMVDRGDGVYIYKDSKNISYNLDLTDVACTDFVERAKVEEYLRENISTLSPTKAVLGGNWYVVSAYIDLQKNSGIVIYEDGHVQEKRNFTYTINAKNEVLDLKIK